MKNERTLIVKVPIKITAYTDENGNTKVCSAEWPSLTECALAAIEHEWRIAELKEEKANV